MLALMLILVSMAAGAEDVAKPQELELRGRIVCLSEEMQRLYGAELPTKHIHQFGFKTVDGGYFNLLRGKHSEALFVDEQVQKKDLVLKGRLFPGTQLFEATLWRSVRDGVVQDLFYWCDICSIRSMDPGICMCCQQPVELMERPL